MASSENPFVEDVDLVSDVLKVDGLWVGWGVWCVT